MRTIWDRLWFKSIDARQYAILRITFGSLSALYFLELWPYIPSQFSGEGWLADIGQIANQNGGSWSLFFLTDGMLSAPVAYAIAGIGWVSAVLLSVGWRSHLAACVAWVVWVSLWNRNPLILDGDDAVLKIMCFYLMLSPCGNAWSLDALKANKPKLVPVWPLRLVQGQIALIYFVSGWVKFHSAEWNDGSVIQYVLIHPHYSRWDGWLILDDPVVRELSALLAETIRWWELLFPLLLLSHPTRRISLAFGILFHIGLSLTMNLRWFPGVMLALYPALIPTESFPHYADKLRDFIGKRISIR